MSKRGNVDAFYQLLLTNTSRQLNVAQLARVLQVNGRRADVAPLAQKENGKQRGVLLNAWIEHSLRTDLAVDDVVVVLFLDRNTDAFDGTNRAYPLAGGRSHSLNDAVIMGVI
ncbi:hypothetical protein ACRYI5_01300 [Furfurilactobacillus sp. WILCCON 0119]